MFVSQIIIIHWLHLKDFFYLILFNYYCSNVFLELIYISNTWKWMSPNMLLLFYNSTVVVSIHSGQLHNKIFYFRFLHWGLLQKKIIIIANNEIVQLMPCFSKKLYGLLLKLSLWLILIFTDTISVNSFHQIKKSYLYLNMWYVWIYYKETFSVHPKNI